MKNCHASLYAKAECSRRCCKRNAPAGPTPGARHGHRQSGTSPVASARGRGLPGVEPANSTSHGSRERPNGALVTGAVASDSRLHQKIDRGRARRQMTACLAGVRRTASAAGSKPRGPTPVRPLRSDPERVAAGYVPRAGPLPAHRGRTNGRRVLYTPVGRHADRPLREVPRCPDPAGFQEHRWSDSSPGGGPAAIPVACWRYSRRSG
jgi:hypothetical protein